jgi:hypothetical protein
VELITDLEPEQSPYPEAGPSSSKLPPAPTASSSSSYQPASGKCAAHAPDSLLDLIGDQRYIFFLQQYAVRERYYAIKAEDSFKLADKGLKEEKKKVRAQRKALELKDQVIADLQKRLEEKDKAAATMPAKMNGVKKKGGR